MNNNYFRITAYHEQENVSAIIDSNGKFEKVWQFSSYLVKKGFTILAVGNIERFDFGNIPAADYDGKCLLLRACKAGKAEIVNKTININGRYYSEIEQKTFI